MEHVGLQYLVITYTSSPTASSVMPATKCHRGSFASLSSVSAYLTIIIDITLLVICNMRNTYHNIWK
jgi:hypothetical protein